MGTSNSNARKTLAAKRRNSRESAPAFNNVDF
jgi:hypothetical protein